MRWRETLAALLLGGCDTAPALEPTPCPTQDLSPGTNHDPATLRCREACGKANGVCVTHAPRTGDHFDTNACYAAFNVCYDVCHDPAAPHWLDKPAKPLAK